MNALRPLLVFVLFLPYTLTNASARQSLPKDVRQVMVAIPNTWDSNRAMFWCFERTQEGWVSVFPEPIPVLLGRKGLAWGRGPFEAPRGRVKVEGDWRTPAGVFAIGKIYGYPANLPEGSDFPYRQVTKYDAWVDDPKNPYYNKHYVAKPGKEPSWFKSQRMRLGDYAYEYRIEVRHNADPPVPGYGSVIFFHIRRGPDRPSAGCTTMAKSNLVKVIRWLREDKNPHYAVLPKAEYERYWRKWGLPQFRAKSGY